MLALTYADCHVPQACIVAAAAAAANPDVLSMCIMVLQNVVAVPVSSAAAHEAAYHGVPLTTLQDAEQVGNNNLVSFDALYSSARQLRHQLLAECWQCMFVDVQ
jgi:hypothetical protein